MQSFMEHGYIKIEENEAGQLMVEAKIENGILWMTKYEIAYLFNVNVISIGNIICAIFKSGVLREEDVTETRRFILNGKESETIMYNLETVIHIGFRVSSFEGKAFRQWATKCFMEYLKPGDMQSLYTLINLNKNSKIPLFVSLN